MGTMTGHIFASAMSSTEYPPSTVQAVIVLTSFRCQCMAHIWAPLVAPAPRPLPHASRPDGAEAWAHTHPRRSDFFLVEPKPWPCRHRFQKLLLLTQVHCGYMHLAYNACARPWSPPVVLPRTLSLPRKGEHRMPSPLACLHTAVLPRPARRTSFVAFSLTQDTLARHARRSGVPQQITAETSPYPRPHRLTAACTAGCRQRAVHAAVRQSRPSTSTTRSEADMC